MTFKQIYFSGKKENEVITYSLNRQTEDLWTGRYEITNGVYGFVKCILRKLTNNYFLPPDSLNGQPYIGKIIDWKVEYKRHLQGSVAHIHFSPKSGYSERKCSQCFYRDFEGAKDHDCHCGEKGDLAKIAFGIPSNQFMPEEIDGKEVGHFCPYWTDPNAD